MNGEIVTRADLDAILSSIFPDAEIDDEYDNFFQPREADIKYLLAANWNPERLRYGSIRPGWPLCYDFAEGSAWVVREAAYKAGWPCRPAFFVLRYTKNNGKRHAINGVVLDDCHIIYSEPQAGAWMDKPEDLKSIENLYI